MPFLPPANNTQTGNGANLYKLKTLFGSGLGSGSEVFQIIAGTNITLSPPSGIGNVTVNAGGGAGSFTSVSIAPANGMGTVSAPINLTGNGNFQVVGNKVIMLISGASVRTFIPDASLSNPLPLINTLNSTGASVAYGSGTNFNQITITIGAGGVWNGYITWI
jgi:hypothetical protein